MNTKYLGLLLVIIIIVASCKKDNTPTDVENKKQKIIAAIDSVIENSHVPGIVAGIWAPDEGIELIYAGGTSDLETNSPMNTDMIFRIGSNTKTMTNTVLLKLVDEGLISLDDKLSDYLPDFPRADEVTIEMLSNMRSGIHSYSEDTAYQQAMENNPSKVWDYDGLISYSTIDNYNFDPGSDFHYSNTNTILIGKIVEQLTGKTLKTLIDEIIIEPLGLTSTRYLSEGVELDGFHPKGYYAGQYDPSHPEYGEFFDVSWAGPAGGAVSTVRELKEYVNAMVDGTFLSAELQQKRLSELYPSIRPDMDYGLGILKYGSYYGHTGSIPGFTSLMFYSLEKNCTMIIWFNCQLLDITPASSGLPDIIQGIIY